MCNDDMNDLNNINNKIYQDYKNIIVPKIELLDVYIKSSEEISIEEVANLFDLEVSYLMSTLKFLNKKFIDKDILFYLISNTDTFITNIIKRELYCGSPHMYSPYHISYIYDLDYTKVVQAFEFLSLELIFSSEIELILIQMS